MPDAARQFELVRIGDLNALAIIQHRGVKKVDLTVDITEATAEDLLENDGDGSAFKNFRRGISEAFMGINAHDASLRQLREAQRGSVTVSINIQRGDLEVVKEGLDYLAGEIADDDEADAFVIHLRDGGKITPTEISVRKPVILEPHANSVNVGQAWNAMLLYMSELEAAGQLGI